MRDALKKIVILVLGIGFVAMIEHLLFKILLSPLGFCIFFVVSGCLAFCLWWPDIKAHRPRTFKFWQSGILSSKQPQRLKAWMPKDGSVTLEQAAFLWLEVPFQRPTPPKVQDRIEIFRNAMSQGSLQMHKRHDETTEGVFALVRLYFGNPIPKDTRVRVKELERYAKSMCDAPNFLDGVAYDATPSTLDKSDDSS